MTPIRDLLDQLGRRGIVLSASPHDGRLSWGAPEGEFRDEDRAELQARREEVLAALADADAVAMQARQMLAELRPRAATRSRQNVLDAYDQALVRVREQMAWSLWQTPADVAAVAARWGVCLDEWRFLQRRDTERK